MSRHQIVIPDIANTYELGYVLFNFPEGTKKIFLKVEEVEIIRKFFQGKYILPNYNADLLLEIDAERNYFFTKLVGDRHLEGWRVSLAEGLLLEREHDTRIFQKRGN